jgi:hypothetical protein
MISARCEVLFDLALTCVLFGLFGIREVLCIDFHSTVELEGTMAFSFIYVCICIISWARMAAVQKAFYIIVYSGLVNCKRVVMP